jgi:hypothetical protein
MSHFCREQNSVSNVYELFGVCSVLLLPVYVNSSRPEDLNTREFNYVHTLNTDYGVMLSLSSGST